VRADYERVRIQHAAKQGQAPLVPLAEARANAFPTDWKGYVPPVPKHLGRKAFEGYDLAEIARYIDWTPFFQAWELTGRYPKILEDPVVGEAARSVFRDAQTMLERIIAERWLTANAVIGLYPANSVGDDVELYTDETRGEVAMVAHCLRQQTKKASDRHNLCLADFVAPQGVRDYLGLFAVTAGIGCDAYVARFEAAHDDYSAIMLKALADRLAEAFAELMHERVRKGFWGYAADEAFAPEALIAESYRHPSGARLSGVSRPHREGTALRAARRAGGRHHSHRELRDVAAGRGERLLLLAPLVAVLRRRQDRPRPGAGLRAAQAHRPRQDRALACAGARVRRLTVFTQRRFACPSSVTNPGSSSPARSKPPGSSSSLARSPTTSPPVSKARPSRCSPRSTACSRRPEAASRRSCRRAYGSPTSATAKA